MNWRCRWFGHKRRSLDGDSATVSIRNVDACDRCGQIFRAKKARSFSYVSKSSRDHEESELHNKLAFKLTGRWPQSVVDSRLANSTFDPSAVNSIMRSVYEDAGRPVPPEYLDDRPRRSARAVSRGPRP